MYKHLRIYASGGEEKEYLEIESVEYCFSMSTFSLMGIFWILSIIICELREQMLLIVQSLFPVFGCIEK